MFDTQGMGPQSSQKEPMKSLPIALVLSLTCLLAHRTPGSELTASLTVQHSQGGGVYLAWATNSTTASAFSHEDSVESSSGSTTARYGYLRVALAAHEFVP